MPRDVFKHGLRKVTSATTLKTTDNILLCDATGSQPPIDTIATPVVGGGTFTNTDFYWVVTATGGPTGESATDTVGANAKPAASGSVTLTWTAAPGATGYRVYRAPLNFANPKASLTSFTRVASLGNVLTYTDTGAAGVAGTPPLANGGTFTVTLPSAVGFDSTPTIDAIGRTPNLVLIQPVNGQLIEGAANLYIGAMVAYRSVTLASDGTNWVII